MIGGDVIEPEDRAKLLECLRSANVLLDEHNVKVDTGDHTNVRFDWETMVTNPVVMHAVCSRITRDFMRKGIGTILGTSDETWPALCIVTAQCLQDASLRIIGPEVSPTGRFKLANEYDDCVRGQKILVLMHELWAPVEAQRILNAIGESEGIVAGLAVVYNGGNVERRAISILPLDTPFVSLIPRQHERWTRQNCPVCTAPKQSIEQPRHSFAAQ